MSKGLEALDNLVQSCFNPCDSDEVLNDKAIVEKELKALEIIREKNVDIQGIIISKDVASYNREYSKYFRAVSCKKNCDDKSCNWGTILIPEGNDYRMEWIGCKATLLTEEEFNLLREVLK